VIVEVNAMRLLCFDSVWN